MAVSPHDLEIVALELVTLYREIVRLAPADEIADAGRAVGRALEALERVRRGARRGGDAGDSVDAAAADVAVARDVLVRLRATLPGPKPASRRESPLDVVAADA